MESNLLRLDLSVLDFDFVTAQNNGNVLANASQITMPVRNILVGDARGDIEHDNGALTLDVVAISQTTELLLTSSIPNIEFDRPAVGVEDQRMDLNTEGCNVFLFEFSSQVTLHESSLPHTTITDKDQFEFWDLLRLNEVNRKTYCLLVIDAHHGGSIGENSN